MSYLIAPSILSADLARLGEDVKAVLDAGADVIHFDVMDNHYVRNLTFGPSICKALSDYLQRLDVKTVIDVHLMAKPVDLLISDFAAAGADMISFHAEASEHIDRSLTLIREEGCQAGLVFNPATPLHYLDHVMDKLDYILLMSVNPGFGGQRFIPETLNKLQLVRQRIDAYQLKNPSSNIRLQIDGGVTLNNIAEIARAGADFFVAGSAIFNQPDYKWVIDQMRLALEE